MKLSQSALTVCLAACGMILVNMIMSPDQSTKTSYAQDAQEAVPEVVRAHQFILVGEDGTERASLAVTDSGRVEFALIGAPGKSMVRISADESRTQIGLVGAGGSERFRVTSSTEKEQVETDMYIFGANGTPAFSLQHRNALEEDTQALDETILSVRDRAGAPRLTLGFTRDQVSQMSFMDSNGEPGATIHYSAASGSVIALDGGKQNATIALTAGKASLLASSFQSGNSALQLLHQDKTRLSVHTIRQGEPEIKFLDAEGEVSWMKRGKDD